MALRRDIGLGGAVLLGLGSIVGTGVFVSLAIAEGITGPSVVLAVAIAAAVATFNGLSSAQLAAAFPVSGGTYEYAHRTLTPGLGLVAGWTFLLAKTASAATAALGCAAYLGWGGRPLAVAIALAMTLVCAGGVRRSNRINAVIVSITLLALATFVVTGLADLDTARFTPAFTGGAHGLFEATALVFVAFTGYGRIATLGEEVREPELTIPRAIVAALIAAAVLYVLVEIAAVGTAPPLERTGWVRPVIAVGAVTAMLGVLLNLILGLSRVVLAMARRGHLPSSLAAEHDGTPRSAVLAVGVAIAALAAAGSIHTAWSISAISVLIYYAITNAAAWKLKRYPPAIPGLIACLVLAVFAVYEISSRNC